MLHDEIECLLSQHFDHSLLEITDEDLDALLRDPDQVDAGAVERACSIQDHRGPRRAVEQGLELGIQMQDRQ